MMIIYRNKKDTLGNLLLNPNDFDDNLSDIEIPSPGFPPKHKLIQKAKNLQSEYDFFMISCQNPFG